MLRFIAQGAHMSKSLRFILLGLAAAVVLVAAGLYAYNRSTSGIAGFYVWKEWSGAAHDGQRADINGISLYYETFGDPAASPVLVLHGGMGFIESMHYQVRALAGTHFVVAPDSRGHGRTTDAYAPITYAQMASDMLALMDRLDIEKADIVGWSDGGIIGLILAMEHPARVGRVVAIGANYHVEGLEAMPSAEMAALNEALAPARDFYLEIAPDPAHWPVFSGKVVHMWRTSPNYTAADLATIEAPVLVMAGEHDSIRQGHTEEMAAAIPGARLAIIPGASHFAPLETPGLVNAAMLDFLNE